MHLHAEPIRPFPNPHDPLGRVVDTGRPGFLGNRQPNLMRDLGRQTVKIKRRDQADHGFRRALGDFGQLSVTARLGVGQSVETPAGTFENPFAKQFIQVLAGDAMRFQVAGPQNSLFTGQLDDPLPFQVAVGS